MGWKKLLGDAKGKMDQTHATNSLDDVKIMWNNWSKKYGKNMKCVHEYCFDTLD